MFINCKNYKYTIDFFIFLDYILNDNEHIYEGKKFLKALIFVKKIIRAVSVCIIIIVFYLFSCGKSDETNKNTKTIGTDIPITYINSPDIGFREQNIGDLFENAGAENKIFLHDMFNLTLSHNNYFYTDAIYVEINSDIENAEIYYTLDSSPPSKENIGTSKKNGIIRGSRYYDGPVFLDKTDNNSPYILKAAAYFGENESNIVTHTYFISPQIEKRFDKNTYVFSVSSDPYNLYDYENGILVEGKLRDDWNKANPGKWADPPEPANYNLEGRDGEREAHIEVLNSGGKLLISQNAGIRIHGGWSRAADKKSLALYARKEYDYIFNRFYYPFFLDDNDKKNDGYESNILSYKTLLLRNGANDRGGAYVREEFSQSLAKKAGFLDYKEFAPAAVFINGEYYGFFWLQTFYNKNYFFDKYGGDDKSFYERLYWYEEPAPGNFLNETVFQKFLDSYDINNFMLYYAFEIYARNWDWPHNNRRMWRYTENGGALINKYLDGKYRMLLYDAEGGWGDWAGINEKTIHRIKTDNSAPVFTALLKRTDMQEMFCCQMFDLINTVFTYESMENELNRIAELYDYEIGVAVKKNVLGNSMENIKKDRKNILKFAEKRELYVTDDMVKSFKLSGDIYYVNIKGQKGAHITLNTLNLNGAGNIYSYYFYEHSVKLTVDLETGYLFDHWLINGKKYENPEIFLNGSYSENGRINAELFTKIR